MRLTIKTPGDVSAFGIALSQNRIGWIALAIGAYLSGTLWLFRSHHAGTDVGADDRRTDWYSTARVSKRLTDGTAACLRARYHVRQDKTGRFCESPQRQLGDR